MTYENAIEKIHSLLTFGSRPGLDRVLQLLDRMGNPQDKLKYIHVAGTNGKGSTCAMLSSMLVAAGYKTGLFISPYITDFRERIQINNCMISESELTDAVEATFPFVEQLSREGIVITEFEYVNALQFYIHSNAKCDIVVLETGMGGLLDCTNVIKPPLCSVITTIGLDHTAILGDTIEEITLQKCGIMKSGSIAVTSAQESEAMRIIERIAIERKIPLAKSASIQLDNIRKTLSGNSFEYNDAKINLHLSGEHQIENCRTALAAIEILRVNDIISITDEQIATGLSRAENPARMELLSENPVVILDGAHNPNGINALCSAIKEFLNDKKIICIMGMLADKDIDSSLALLKGYLNTIYTVPINNPRALSSDALAEKCRNLFDDVTSFDNAEKAFDTAFEKAQQDDSAVIICGSLYLAGEIRPYIKANIDKKENVYD